MGQSWTSTIAMCTVFRLWVQSPRGSWGSWDSGPSLLSRFLWQMTISPRVCWYNVAVKCEARVNSWEMWRDRYGRRSALYSFETWWEGGHGVIKGGPHSARLAAALLLRWPVNPALASSMGIDEEANTLRNITIRVYCAHPYLVIFPPMSSSLAFSFHPSWRR